MNRYESYKDSGAAWIGEIPTDWTMERLKTLVRNVSDKVSSGNTGSPYIGLENIQSRTGKYVQSDQPISPDGTANLFQPSDFLFGKLRPYLAKAFIPDFSGKCSTELLVLRPLKAEREFLFYFTLSDRFIQIVNSSTYGAKMPRASWDFIGNLPACLPDAKQQRLVAHYLDKETTRIDQLIANKSKQIKKLGELRQITISNAVSRGLDPTVPMKDSGIDWLGEIPAHWRIKRVRDIALLLQTGPFGSQLHSDEYISDGIPVINPSHLIHGNIIPDNKVTIDQQTHERLSRHSIRANDIIFARRGEMGRSALVTKDEEGWLCGTGSLLFRPNVNRSYPPYHSFVLASKGIKEWLELRSVGSTMDNLNTEILGQIPLPMPPSSEQKSIHDFIGVESVRFDKLINNINSQIEKLEELRKITINDAVTGKVKVTD